MTHTQRVRQAVADVTAGRPVVVAGDAAGCGAGALIFAAQRGTAELVAFVVRHTTGFIQVVLSGSDCERLQLPPMHDGSQDTLRPAQRVAVDARTGVTTGISATDRARTIRVLADPDSHAHDLNRPGHVVPLRAEEGGVLWRPGLAEAAFDLAVMAGLRPAGVLCELVSAEDTSALARPDELAAFAFEHNLTMITTVELVAHRGRFERHVVRKGRALLSTAHGAFESISYYSPPDGVEHIALLVGDLAEGDDVLVRVHSECVSGEVFGGSGCDCALQLDAALATVAAEGRGLVIYLRGQRGCGPDLGYNRHPQPLRAAATVSEREQLLEASHREERVAAEILGDLGVASIRLLVEGLTTSSLEQHGLDVQQVSLPTVSASAAG